jgi:DNA transformation protein and related proteins
MVASDGFAEFLRDQLAPLGRITMRRMFGKTGVFCDGFMLAMVRDNTLYFRVDVRRSACSTSPTSLSFGRRLRSQRRGGLLRRENAQRESENQRRSYERLVRKRAVAARHRRGTCRNEREEHDLGPQEAPDGRNVARGRRECGIVRQRPPPAYDPHSRDNRQQP